MKKFLLGCFIVAAGLTACQKTASPLEDDPTQAPNTTDTTKSNTGTKPNDSTKTNDSTKNNYYVTVTINGKDSAFILADCDTSFTSIVHQLTVYGYTDSTKKKYIWFEIEKRAVGTYNWNEMGFLDYPPDYKVDPYTGVEQTNIVTITYIDDKVVEGTFSGVCNNDRWDPTIFHDAPYIYLHYTNGKFRAKIGH